MRVVTIPSPGLEGMRPDVSQTKLGLNATYDAQDAIAQKRKFHERNGWRFLSEKPAVTINADFTSVSRCRYVLADRRTLVMSHHLPEQGFKAWVEGTEVNLQYPINWLAWHQYRDSYRDSAFYCGNDGEAPMLVYSGTTHQGTGTVALGSMPASKSIFRLPSAPGASTYPSATYLHVAFTKQAIFKAPDMYVRVLERSGTDISCEGVKSRAADVSAAESAGHPFGMTWPNVAVYGAGTITVDSATGKATVSGGKFVTGDWGHVIADTDALLYQQPSDAVETWSQKWVLVDIKAVDSDTVLSVDGRSAPDALYFIMRRSPFTDACVHKRSPVFSGVKQHPARVYFGQPNTNLSVPPGWPAGTPFTWTDDPQFQSADMGAFELFPIDVPDEYGDPVIAVLPAGDAVLVCKRRSFHAVYGVYPDYTQRLIDDGAGCIHRGGAVATFSGVWVAGDEALYTWRDGRMLDLMFDKVATLWHGYTRHFTDTDWVSIGERDGHLFITITSHGQQKKATFCYDIRRDEWMSVFTNFAPLHYFSGEQGGDSIECLAVDPEHNGEVINAGHMVEETAPRMPDSNGLGPSFAYESTLVLAQAGGMEGETILADVAIHARLDAPSPGKDELSVTVSSHGGVGREPGVAMAAKTLTPIVASGGPVVVDRFNNRVNSKGRTHKLRIERADNARPVGSYCELMQINLSVIDAGMDT